jgi:hypothetical protein
MDILTLGKMNQMAKDVDQTLEYLANSTFQALKDVCDFQEGNMSALQAETAAGILALEAAGGGGGSGPQYALYIGCSHHNGETGMESVNYGGHQCAWTVPADTKGIKFEIYGGGGSGFGACCCMVNPLPGGSGAYAVKHLNEEDGDFVGDGTDVYQLCSAGTGCCWASSHGQRGHTSYVTGPGLSNFCALGGNTGEHHCQNWNCYTCCQTCFGCAALYGADYGQSGRSGWRKSSQHCASSMFSIAPGPSGPLSPGDAKSHGGCTNDMHTGGGPHSPGTGSHGAVTHGGCCCGKAGGGGAVVVTYWK